MRKMIVILAAVVAVSTVANAGIYAWSSYDELSDLDPGFDLNTVTGKSAIDGSWISIYQTVVPFDDSTQWFNAITFDKSGTATGINVADTLVFTSAVIDDGGWLLVDDSATLGIGYYYTVVLDGADFASADYSLVLQSSTFEAKVADALPAGDYSVFNGEAAGTIAWQAIPEPATLGLLGVAGLGLFLARKKAHR